MKWGRNSSYQLTHVVAVFSLMLSAALLSAQTAQSSAMSPEEKQAREAIEKYLIDGPGKNFLSAAIDALNALPSPYEGVKPGLNTGMAEAIKATAKIKAENPAHRIIVPEDQAFTSVAAQIGTLVGQAAAGPYSTPKLREARDRFYAMNLIGSKSDFTSKSIRAADTGGASAAPGSQGQYDPNKGVLKEPGYRGLLKSAAPTVDHLLANANVDQSQAEGAVALERGSIINKALESSRKLPELMVSSFAFEARTLSPSEFEKARTELASFITSNIAADSDEVNAAIETFSRSFQKGINPNTPAFERANTALKAYVSDALRNAELGATGGSFGAGRKGGAQKNLQ
jgi:hypothetical protein